MKLIEVYKYFVLSTKGTIDTILIILPYVSQDTIIEYNSNSQFKSEKAISKYFEKYELSILSDAFTQETPPHIVFSHAQLQPYDRVEVFQHVFLRALNMTRDYTVDDIYMYGMSNHDYKNEGELFTSLTDNEYVSKHALMAFLSNVQFSKDKNIMKKTKHEQYNYNTFTQMKLLKQVAREKRALSSISKMSKYTHYMNPYKAIEQLLDKDDDDELVKQMTAFQEPSSATGKRSLQDLMTIDTTSSIVSFYVCMSDVVVKTLLQLMPTQYSGMSIAYITKLYFPSYKSFQTKGEMDVQRMSFIDDGERKKQLERTVMLLSSRNLILHNNEHEMKTSTFHNVVQTKTGVQTLIMKLSPRYPMSIVLETLFHAIQLNSECKFIKYNPGSKLQSHYRAFYDKDETALSKAYIQRVSSIMGKKSKRSLCCFYEISFKGKLYPVILEIHEQGNMVIHHNNESIRQERHSTQNLSISELEEMFREFHGKLLKDINSYYHMYDEGLPSFNNFGQSNVSMTQFICVQKHTLKENKHVFVNIQKYLDATRNIFEVSEFKDNAYVKCFYKTNTQTVSNMIPYVTFRRSNTKAKVFETVYENISHFNMLPSIMYLFNCVVNKSATSKVDVDKVENMFVDMDDVITDNISKNGNIEKQEGLSEMISNGPQDEIMISEDMQKNDGKRDSKDEEDSEDEGEENNNKPNIFGLRARKEENDNNDEYFGGAGKPQTAVKQGQPRKNELRNYTLQRIAEYDEELVKNERRENRNYSRYCPSSEKRQPIVINESEKETIDRVAPGSYGDEPEHILKYGKQETNSGETQNLYYICPRYWCVDKNISLPHNRVQNNNNKLTSDMCETGEILDFDHPLYHHTKGKEVSKEYNNLYPRIVNPKKSNIPCCFKNKAKTATAVVDEDPKKRKNERILEYNKMPISKQRHGLMPLNTKSMFDTPPGKCDDGTGSCFLRYGTHETTNMSFWEAVYFVIKMHQNSGSKMNKKFFKNYGDVRTFMKNTIIDKALNLDDFVMYQNSTLVMLFENFGLSDDVSATSTTTNTTDIEKMIEKYQNTETLQMLDMKSANDKTVAIRVIKSYMNYQNYLQSNMTIDYKYVWDLICKPNKHIFDTGVNMIILELSGFEVDSPLHIVCPYNSTLPKFNPNTFSFILLKHNDKYEPVIFRERQGKLHYRNKVMFDMNNVYLKSFLEKMKVIYNDNDFCGAYLKNLQFEKTNPEYAPNYVENVTPKLEKSGFQIMNQVVNIHMKTCGLTVRHNEDDENNEHNGSEYFLPLLQSSTNMKSNYTKMMLSKVETYHELDTTLLFLEFVDKKTNDEMNYKARAFVVDNDIVVGVQCANTLVVPIFPPKPYSQVEGLYDLATVPNNTIFVDEEINSIVHNDELVLNSSSTHTPSTETTKENIRRLVSSEEEYSKLRNHIKSNLHLVENRDIKSRLDNIFHTNTFNGDHQSYTKNMKLLKPLLEELYAKNSEKFTTSQISKENDVLSSMIHRLCDELLRQNQVREYVFVDKKYMLYTMNDVGVPSNEIQFTENELDDKTQNILEQRMKRGGDESIETIYDTAQPEKVELLKYDDGLDLDKIDMKKYPKTLRLTKASKATQLMSLTKQDGQEKGQIKQNQHNNTRRNSNSANNNIKTKRKRCPKGTRRNKDGICVESKP